MLGMRRFVDSAISPRHETPDATMPSTNAFVHAFATAIAIVVPSYRLRYLTFDGSIAALGVGTVVFAAGWTRALQLLVFFLLGSVTSKYKKREKAQLAPYQPPPEGEEDVQRVGEGDRASSTATAPRSARSVPRESSHERNGRNAVQVLATAGLPTLMCACSMLPWWPELAPWMSLSYFVFMCVNLADTLASEIGMLSRQTPRLITSWSQRVAPGVDGGVTFLGTNASVLGGILMGLCEDEWWSMCWMGALWGIIGSACDSLLGVYIQSRPHPPTTSGAHPAANTRPKHGAASASAVSSTAATVTPPPSIAVDLVHSPMSYERWHLTNSLVNFLSCVLTCLLACLHAWLERVDDGSMSLTPVLVLLAVLLWLQSAPLRDNAISVLAWFAFAVWACCHLSSVVQLVCGALLMLHLHVSPASSGEEEEEEPFVAARAEHRSGSRDGGAPRSSSSAAAAHAAPAPVQAPRRSRS